MHSAIERTRLPCPCSRLPSGLHGVTGQPLGQDCVVATHTLAMLTSKPGMFTGAGRDHAGDIWLDALGVSTFTEGPLAWLSGSSNGATATRSSHSMHKGSFGDVAVIGGARGMNGAALLAARAAHAAGAGRVYVELLDHTAQAPHIDPARFSLIILDKGLNSVWGKPEKYYTMSSEPVFASADVYWPVVGLQVRPTFIMVPK